MLFQFIFYIFFEQKYVFRENFNSYQLLSCRRFLLRDFSAVQQTMIVKIGHHIFNENQIFNNVVMDNKKHTKEQQQLTKYEKKVKLS